MNYKERSNYWLNHPMLDKRLKEELLMLDDEALELSFHKDLDFGTGGLRGVIGVGSNRMNMHTVKRATQGLANHLLKGKKDLSVAIAYDSRNFSKEFADDAASVLTANGIKVFLFEDLRPTPELSFAVRELKCDGGIVVTASHNPKEYNGYKVYGSDGGQITLEAAKSIIAEINNLDYFDVKTMALLEAIDTNLLAYLGQTMDDLYLEKVKALSKRSSIFDGNPFKIVYTPIHGTGLKLVTELFDALRYKNLHVVKEQAKPDGNFPTVKSPNPEEREAFTIAIKQAKAIQADLIFGTDPDTDRVGVVIKADQDYRVLTGNEIGALLTNYMLETHAPITKRHAIINTIVTSDLGHELANKAGASTFKTLTGFKFIGEKIKEFEKNGTYDFLLGYEESYGYLAGTFVRDKDAVIASLLIVEMALYYNSLGKALSDILEEIYTRYGYYINDLETHKFIGVDGQEKIAKIVNAFRDLNAVKTSFSGMQALEDYDISQRTNILKGCYEKIELPKSNVVKLLKEDSWIAIRPSGTEPKLKIYYSVRHKSKETAEEKLKQLKNKVKDFIQREVSS